MNLYFSDNLVLCLLIDTFFKHSYNRWDQWFRSPKRLYWGAQEIAQENWARSSSSWVSNHNLLYFNMFMIMSGICFQHTSTIFRWNNPIVAFVDSSSSSKFKPCLLALEVSRSSKKKKILICWLVKLLQLYAVKVSQEVGRVWHVFIIFCG